MRTLSMAVLAGLGLAMLVGCQKTFTLEFANMTEESRCVELHYPNGGVAQLGTLHKFPNSLVKKVKVDKDDLPLNLEWTAGDISGNANLEKDGPSWVAIQVGGKGDGSGAGAGNTIRHDTHTDVRKGDERNVQDTKERTTKKTHIIVE